MLFGIRSSVLSGIVILIMLVQDFELIPGCLKEKLNMILGWVMQVQIVSGCVKFCLESERYRFVRASKFESGLRDVPGLPCQRAMSAVSSM